jgi:hypothetical protein
LVVASPALAIVFRLSHSLGLSQNVGLDLKGGAIVGTFLNTQSASASSAERRKTHAKPHVTAYVMNSAESKQL